MLRAFHELKEELKRNKNDSFRFLNYETDEDSLAALHFVPISESLQAEIESTLESEGKEMNQFFKKIIHFFNHLNSFQVTVVNFRV